MGVGGDGIVMATKQPNPPVVTEGYRSSYLFTQARQSQQPVSNKCWVNIIQHLLITSIQGNHELHADNG